MSAQHVAHSTPADWLELTKPRIAALLLVTCAGTMAIAAQGMPPLGITLVTLIGLALSSGGASALNHVLDRDIDQRMTRTQDRPVARGAISVPAATAFGLTLLVVPVPVVWSYVNGLTAMLTLAGGLFYVLVYTMMLKRTTPQNIVIGGAAGAMPPLVGWAAVNGEIAFMAVVLFLIIFLWTPPHFWALAMLVRDDYAAAGVPMLPVVAGNVATARQSLIYAVATVVVSLIPFATGDVGLLYAVVAVGAGARFIQLSLALMQAASFHADDVRTAARAVFLWSMAYLALVFAAAVVDALI